MVGPALRDQRGAVAVEFALVSIPLLLLILGGIEIGYRMYVQVRLRGVLEQAARMATIGDVDANGTSGDAITAYVKDQLTVMKGATVDVVPTHYDQFSQVRQPEPKDTAGTTAPYCFTDENGNGIWDADPSQAGLGGANDIINYKVTVKYPALFPFITNMVTHQPIVEATAQATLQNEPFGGNTDVTPKHCCVSAAAGNPTTCT